ncbi:hypothetical protein VTO42DRAFT_7720 [Malbranchea cinnamomea]
MMSNAARQSDKGPPPGMPSGPPYIPTVAMLGGRATVSIDVPVCAVFIAMFVVGAVGHMSIFRKNIRRGHRFIPSAATFGFCMARIVALILRLAGATHPMNISLAIAGQVFVAAGVLLLFILNLLFAQRMLRASQPRLGWSRSISIAFRVLYILVFLTLVIVIVASVQTFFTLDQNTRRICRNLQLYGASFFTFVSFLPLPILAYAYVAPSQEPIDQFGIGSWESKALVVGISGILLCLGAGFRLGTNAMPPRPITDPAWYHHKACFYIFNFGVEISVVYLWLFGRIDRRFYVPDGSSKVRNYSGIAKSPGESGSNYPEGVKNGKEASPTA